MPRAERDRRPFGRGVGDEPAADLGGEPVDPVAPLGRDDEAVEIPDTRQVGLVRDDQGLGMLGHEPMVLVRQGFGPIEDEQDEVGRPLLRPGPGDALPLDRVVRRRGGRRCRPA